MFSQKSATSKSPAIRATITEVCFTWALPGGMWIKKNGKKDWWPDAEIVAILGQETYEEFRAACDIGGIGCGCWHDVSIKEKADA